MKPLTRPWLPKFKRRTAGELPANWAAESRQDHRNPAGQPGQDRDPQGLPELLEAFGKLLPEFMGGSADLAPSNLTVGPASKS